MTEPSLPRGHGDIQTAVVNLVDRMAPVIPVSHQPDAARNVAAAIAGKPSSMRHSMFLRQSIIRRATAADADVIEGLTAWVIVLFDLANLQHDRRRALDLKTTIADAALQRLSRALARSPNGCILAVPHIGSIELFAAHLKDRGFNVGFIYTIGDHPTPTERWIYAGRSAIGGTPIAFGRRTTGDEIAKLLAGNGVLFMVVDVYPSDRYQGIRVSSHGAEFNYPPGPARYARAGTLVLPGFASRRDREGFAMHILDPIDDSAATDAEHAASDFTQRLADQIGAFTAEHPAAYWLWHPIPNDPYLAIARRQRPDLVAAAAPPDDEAVALAIEAL